MTLHAIVRLARAFLVAPQLFLLGAVILLNTLSHFEPSLCDFF
jgi:hypothetical protein